MSVRCNRGVTVSMNGMNIFIFRLFAFCILLFYIFFLAEMMTEKEVSNVELLENLY